MHLAEAGLLVVATASTIVWLYAASGVALSIHTARAGKRTVSRGGVGGSVSVVIAARDEEANLSRLLPLLLEAGPPLLEVVVVDDGSSDATPQLLESLAEKSGGRLRWLRIEETPRGWAPKSYALHRGAMLARGDVLLFLDADIEPWDPGWLLATASSVGEDVVLGFVPRFLCRTRRCKACEAVLTALAFGFYSLHRAATGRGTAWIYGCCWAVRRETYRRLGGHEAVKASIVEDRDFASYARERGVRLVFVDARDRVGVWTYDTISGHAMLVGRLARDKMKGLSRARRTAYIASVLALLYTPTTLAAHALLAGNTWEALPLTAQLAAYAAGALAEGYSPLYALPGLAAQALVPLGLLWAAKGRVRWKRRSL